jgi:colanic acid/amylovoran biosynthesis glycosyltransferase
MPKKIAYLINQYPMVSHTFIRREVLAVESKGFDVLRIALRGWDEKLVSPQDIEEQRKTHYVLRSAMLPLVAALIKTLLTDPKKFFPTLLLSFHMGRRSDRPQIYHFIYLAEACRILLWLRSFGATHLHAHFCSNSTEIAMFVRLLGGPPYSFTIHGTAEFDKLDFLGIEEKIRRSAFVISVSSFGSSQIYRRIHHNLWKKIHLIHCGIESDFYEAALTQLPITPSLVCVGRLSKEKGHLLLIEAAAHLAKEGINFNLIFAGDGELRNEIELLGKKYGIDKHLRITGWISSDSVRHEILSAQGLVLASFSEGLPVVIMEAMALHRPVIASCVGGIPELVQPGENGWLFPPGDVGKLTLAIKEFLASPRLKLERMGNNGHNSVVLHHSINIEITKLVTLFRLHSN